MVIPEAGPAPPFSPTNEGRSQQQRAVPCIRKEGKEKVVQLWIPDIWKGSRSGWMWVEQPGRVEGGRELG